MHPLRHGALALALIGAAGAAQAGQPIRAGDVVVRFGAATVDPHTSSGHFSVAPLTGGKLDVGNDTRFGLSATYMLTNRLGVELLAATPFKHDIYLTHTPLGRTRIGSTRELPPTLLLQYRLPSYGPVHPYLGAGVNYTHFYDESIDNTTVGPLIGGAQASVSLADSVGVAGELGVDIDVARGWFVNLSAWRMDINTTARLRVNGQTVDKVSLSLNPWVWMAGVGHAF